MEIPACDPAADSKRRDRLLTIRKATGDFRLTQETRSTRRGTALARVNNLSFRRIVDPAGDLLSLAESLVFIGNPPSYFSDANQHNLYVRGSGHFRSRKRLLD